MIFFVAKGGHFGNELEMNLIWESSQKLAAILKEFFEFDSKCPSLEIENSFQQMKFSLEFPPSFPIDHNLDSNSA